MNFGGAGDWEGDGPAPGSYACHLSVFERLGERTRLTYNHYRVPFQPVIAESDIPSEEFDRWEKEVWPTWDQDLLIEHDTIEVLSWINGEQQPTETLVSDEIHYLLPQSNYDESSFEARIWSYNPFYIPFDVTNVNTWGVYIDLDG